MDLSELLGFGNYKDWHCKFPFERLSTDNHAQEIIKPELRINQLAERVELLDARILELGCLEGCHSMMLHELGAKEIIAIEGRKDSFLKCLIVKNAFRLTNCKFLLGDINQILYSLPTHFDLCLALGILYHLNNPISIMHRIGEISDKLFAWTHFATKDYPEGPLREIKHNNYTYRGKYIREDVDNNLSALDKKSFWIFEDDLLAAILDSGFKNIEIIKKENHENGPAITFLAQK